MIFTPTALQGAYIVEIERIEDERGFFARAWCRKEFEARGLKTRLDQCSVSYNPRKGTLRGLHYQIAPHDEAKLVRCTRGSVFDAVVDLRRGSPSCGRTVSVVLTADERNMIYVPEGCAHGLLTLEDDTEIFYQIAGAYVPGAQRGVRWDDPAFSIPWPAAPLIISERDRSYPDFTGCE